MPSWISPRRKTEHMKNGMTADAQALVHPIPPTWDKNSEVLILGSFPSVKSREMAYFYGHPQNRFWKVMAALFSEPVPQTVEERRSFLLRNHVAAWDVIASCTIVGSSDSSIRNVEINDLTPVLRSSRIRRICVNGGTACKYFEKYTIPHLKAAGLDLSQIKVMKMPSTSPANAAWTLEKLLPVWQDALT